ncbi:ATP-dependent helicase/nuclease subunit A, partial [human gut metagenome]
NWLKENAEAFNIETMEKLNNSKWVLVLKNSIKVEIEGYIKMLEKVLFINSDIFFFISSLILFTVF